MTLNEAIASGHPFRHYTLKNTNAPWLVMHKPGNVTFLGSEEDAFEELSKNKSSKDWQILEPPTEFEVRQMVGELVDYLWHEEQRHYGEDPCSNHIFVSLWRLNEFYKLGNR